MYSYQEIIDYIRVKFPDAVIEISDYREVKIETNMYLQFDNDTISNLEPKEE